MPTKDLEDCAAVAEAVRAACVDAAVQADQDAGIRGLCDDGRWESAIAAIRRLHLQSVMAAPGAAGAPPYMLPTVTNK